MPIPTPLVKHATQALSGLRVFGADGERLYQGLDRDYAVVNSAGQFAIQVQNPRVQRIRFSASFKALPLDQPGPALRFAPGQLQSPIAKLREVGFRSLPDALEGWIAKNGPVEAQALAQMFQASSDYYDSSKHTKLGLSKSLVTDDHPFKEFERYLDSEGHFCAECDGGNALFRDFLKTVYGPESPIRIETVGVLVRDPEDSTKFLRTGHRVTLLWLPGHSHPVVLDATPAGGLSSTFLNGSEGRQHDQEEVTRALPAWLEAVQDQIPEPPKLPVVHASEGPIESENRKAALQEMRDTLKKAVETECLAGNCPDPQRWDRAEPLAQITRLASLANAALHDVTPATLSVDLLRLDQAFSQYELNSREAILGSIAEYARTRRQQFEKRYLEGVAGSRFTHYQNPNIQDPLVALFREIEGLGNPGKAHGKPAQAPPCKEGFSSLQPTR